MLEIALEPEAVARQVLEGAPSLGLFLDFDGTLAEIVDRPPDAFMLPGIWTALEELIARGVRVGIISGRGLDDLAAHADLEGAWLVGSHGAELFDAKRARVSLLVDTAARSALEALHRRALEVTVPLGALVEDKGLSVAVHLRGLTDFEKLQIVEMITETTSQDPFSAVAILRGHEVIEVRARTVDKGRASRTLIETWGPIRAVALGDDVTDEDMFAEVIERGGVAIKVGTGPSVASLRLADPNAVEAFLVALLRGLPPKARRV